MYRVQLNNENWKRHADQIRVRKAKLAAYPTADYWNDEDFEIQESQLEQVVECNLPAADASPIAMQTEESNSRSPVVQEQQELVQVPVVSRYPKRIHVPPDRFIEEC